MAQSAMKIKMIDMQDIQLVGFRVLCPGDQYINEIPVAAYRLENHTHEIKHLVNPRTQIGVFIAGECTDEEDGYWICKEVSKFEGIPEGMVTLTVPPRRYAVYHYQGVNSHIRKAYEDLHNWIDERNFSRLTGTWCLEIYHDWKDKGRLSVELLDPIK
ncbi:GyrI-like domain-containing protein [Bacillus sp. SG-1]|uniref:GyrI-like domain-containing protein n=1 Tax=Bacillus sp. SG-1 TaxID=161544 RepID=UPI00015434D0|nr:GyrI-like domain-containing protein [Bacillus sp. SG-1]EDL66299.1 bacterial transcription activator family protein [Bacillus sp. SG-1]